MTWWQIGYWVGVVVVFLASCLYGAYRYGQGYDLTGKKLHIRDAWDSFDNAFIIMLLSFVVGWFWFVGVGLLILWLPVRAFIKLGEKSRQSKENT